jgi:predicted MFS family arabinose efflux permease
LWIVCLAVLINRTGTMVLPFLVLYLTQREGFSASEAGFTLTLYGLGSLITAPLAGRLCDRVGPPRIMKTSLLLSGAMLLLFPAVHGKTAIQAATLALAVLNESFRPASMAMLTGLAPLGMRRATFALHRLAINLGMSVGPAAGGFLALVSFPALFYVDGATSILAGLVLAFSSLRSEWRHEVVPRDGAVPRDDALPRGGAVGCLGHLRGFTDPRLMLFLAAMIPVLVVFFQHQAAMPLFLVRDAGMPASAYGLLFTINTGLIILLEVPLNLAMAGWRHQRALALGALLTGAGFGAMALAGNIYGIAATVAVWTFGEMILLPGSSAYAAEIAPADRRGEYMGLYVMSFSMAFTVGPWLGAEVYERFGGNVLWSAAFLCGCLSAAMMARLPDARSPITRT